MELLEVNKINKKIAITLSLAAIAFATIMGGLFLTTNAAGTNSTTNTAATTNNLYNETSILPFQGFSGMGFGRHGCEGGIGTLNVSSAYIANVTSILKNDTDVQNLLAQGYNITMIRPVIRSFIDGNGNISMKATTAIVRLRNGTSGYATVLVDLEQGKVTKIVTTTRTVIQK